MTQIDIGTNVSDLDVWMQCYSAPVTIHLSRPAIEAIKSSRNAIETIIASDKPVYGINTGFGRLSNQSVRSEDLHQLQENLVLSHTVGAGDPLPTKIVRLAMALKIASFAKGFSGIRLEVVQRLQLFVENEIYPIIPEKGSVGASGDLAPLAHLSAALIGAGDVEFKGKIIPAESVHKSFGLTPLRLEAKEGLALLNGTQISTALALAGLFEAERCFATAIVVGSITTEAVLGLEEAFDSRIHALRRQKGQIEVATTIRELIANSGFRAPSLKTGRRQDPYSIRCQPQVLGACRDLLSQVAEVLTREADAVTDNPLVFADSLEVLSGGNFHAEPVAFAADILAMAICEIGSLSERRLALMTDSSLSGLPPFLTSEPGLNSGFMSAQIAAAAMVAENRQRAYPASVDNVPTVANQEDLVSMATHGARRVLTMIDTLDNILASELLAAVEGCDHRGFVLNPALEAVRSMLRASVPRMNRDRYFAPAHSQSRLLVRQSSVLEAARWGSLSPRK
ncbi:histidine ammonia-lyase [Bisporella sp. PMI_857]|nr:histidine ammonia-lyase [Bisporella sp. PMI_857]